MQYSGQVVHVPSQSVDPAAQLPCLEILSAQTVACFVNSNCATLCVSAVFAVARCLSVRPSVTLVHCIHTAEDIVKFLSRPDSPII